MVRQTVLYFTERAGCEHTSNALHQSQRKRRSDGEPHDDGLASHGTEEREEEQLVGVVVLVWLARNGKQGEE